MAQYTAYAYYNIWFTQQADYDFAVAVAGGNLIDMAPRDAATLFGIPHPYPSGDMATIDKTITFQPPMIPGNDIGHPSASGVILTDTAAQVLVPGQGGNPASSYPVGPDMLLIWTGVICRLNGAGQSAAPTNTIPQRRWIQGFELSPDIEDGTTFDTGLLRAASRVIGGIGYAIRGGTQRYSEHAVAESRTGLVTATSWERFYFRPRTIPTSLPLWLWRSFGFPSAQIGASMMYQTDGTILVSNQGSVIGSSQAIGTISGLELGRYYRFDIFQLNSTGTGSPNTNGRLRIFLDGVEVINFLDNLGYGLGASTRHVRSILGNQLAVAETVGEYDLDDWICADLPGNVDASTLAFATEDYPVDWLMGSHVESLHAVSNTQVGWVNTAGIGTLNNIEFNKSYTVPSATSSTSGAIIDATTDHTNDQTTMAQKYGLVAAVMAVYGSTAGALDNDLGFGLGASVSIWTNVFQSNIATIGNLAYLPSGMLTPTDVFPLHIGKRKAADAGADTTRGLMAVAEYIGLYGPEDVIGGEGGEPLIMDAVQNCMNPHSLWGYIGGLTDGPVCAIGGTYVGNGTIQDINLPLPCHFLLIRGLNNTVGVIYLGASMGPHRGPNDELNANVRVWEDETGQTKFTVVGTTTGWNAAAITYQYIAFCDPGARFNLVGSYQYLLTGPSPRTTNLIDPEFEAKLAIFGEDNAALSNNPGFTLKYPGSLGTTGVTLDGSAVALAATIGVGSIETYSGVHINTAMSYSLWRERDAACGDVMCQIFEYTGTGVNPRVVPFPEVTGRFPLYAQVQPTLSGTGYFRDPSHAGTNSTSIPTFANSTTGIVGGAVDSITVQSSLNVLGTRYSVFIILGNDVSWANGIYFPPNCEAPYPVPQKPPLPTIAVAGEGGLVLSASTPLTLLLDVSGIYTLVPGKTHDTLIDRQPGVVEVDLKIPDIVFKTGYIGG